MPAKQANISGLLNINKPKGLTSHDVVARIRKLSGQRKVGHTGTLDPMATGVLLVCLGQATRLIEYIQSHRKRYRGLIRFGLTTDTLDAEGQILSQSDTSGLTEEQLRQILPQFQGDIEQIPPLFSALKQGGQPLYKLARAGRAANLSPRLVTIHSLTWVAWQPPDLILDIDCSAGTYIRSLARDLGEAAGPGAHLAELARLANGDWTVEEAVSLDRLEHEAVGGSTTWQKYLYPLDQAVAHLPQVILSETEATAVAYGQAIHLSETTIIPPSSSFLRAYTADGDFLAILTQTQSDDKLWQPKKVFHSGGKVS